MLTHHQWLGNPKGHGIHSRFRILGGFNALSHIKEVSLKNKTIQINEALMDTSLRLKKSEKTNQFRPQSAHMAAQNPFLEEI